MPHKSRRFGIHGRQRAAVFGVVVFMACVVVFSASSCRLTSRKYDIFSVFCFGHLRDPPAMVVPPKPGLHNHGGRLLLKAPRHNSIRGQICLCHRYRHTQEFEHPFRRGYTLGIVDIMTPAASFLPRPL